MANTGQLSRAANIKYRKLSIERVLCFFYHSDDVFFGKKFIEIKLQGRLGDTSRDKLFVFQYAENFLFNFGMDGKGCLLRAICETHETPLLGHGMIGEILELFLT